MQVKASEISQLLNGIVEGNPDVLVSKPSKIEEGGAGTISFLANPKYEQYAYSTTASILLVSKDFKPKQAITSTLIRVDDVYASIALLLNQFGQQVKKQTGIDATASIHPSANLDTDVSIGTYTVIEEGASIGEGTIIYPQVYVGKNVKIGKNCILYAGVKVYHECEIGDHCIVHANAVIGSDGFGFAPQEDGSYKKIAQIGNVVLEQQVEVGANTTIDRATMGSTIIRAGVKLDNLIQVAHNVEIGTNTVIAAQSGIAGSTKIGKQCMIGGQVGFVGHITIADGTKVQAQSGINRSLKTPNTAIFGTPAMPYRDYLRSYALFRQFPALAQKINALEKQLKELEEKKPPQ